MQNAFYDAAHGDGLHCDWMDAAEKKIGALVQAKWQREGGGFNTQFFLFDYLITVIDNASH